MTDSRGPGEGFGVFIDVGSMEPYEGYEPVVPASFFRPCHYCGELWCDHHSMHRRECPCIGPDEDSVQYITAPLKGYQGIMVTWGRRIRYKLMRQRKDGSLGPLFINRSQRISVGEWMDAENHPTKGYAHRPGWHVTLQPYAPHLSMKGRVWMCVAVTDYEEIDRPERQGGKWLLAQRMIVLGGLNDELHTSS